ncbi:lig_chan-Glu_bd domain-containing protein [Caerostris darwini]|uniref:Lig_chan-Glu_bd domain-containing protein n=1 Tax=Caerostris darwini TaxID=1538125 RepID=A0AAV4NQW4_9ARAC|nr:lig_chan-Glu_bd domain-containing protein [Caerostris darwini]
MAVGDLSWTLDRSIAVDLTEAVFPETVTFIYRTPGFYSRTWILFEDIDFRVWISLTFAMILGCSVYCLTLYVSEACGYEGKRPESKEEAFVQAAVRSTAAIYKTLVGQSILHHPKAISCRTVLGTWFIGALILSSLYGGSLTSTLSLHRSPRPADTLKDLVKRYPNAQLAVKDSSQIHSYVKKSDVWRHMWLTNMQKYVIPGKLHIEDTMEEVHRIRPEGQPIYVWIAERSMLVKQMHKYSDDPSVCDLYVAKEDIVRSDWVLALTKNSPFLPQFNEKITRMHRFGLLQKWQIEHWNSNQGACRPSDGRNQNGAGPLYPSGTPKPASSSSAWDGWQVSSSSSSRDPWIVEGSIPNLEWFFIKENVANKERGTWKKPYGSKDIDINVLLISQETKRCKIVTQFMNRSYFLIIDAFMP